MIKAMVCPKCNSAISDTAKFCPKCGEKFDRHENAGDTIICPECKTAYPATTRFCKKDGAQLQVAQSDQKPEAATDVTGKPQSPGIKEELSPPIGQADMVACPQCGIAYPKTTKFCKKDGTSLRGAALPEKTKVEIHEAAEKKADLPRPEIKKEPPVQPLKIQAPLETIEYPKTEPLQQASMAAAGAGEPKSKKPLLFILIGFIVLAGAGIGGYLYFTKKGNTPVAVQKPATPQVPEPQAPQKTDETVKTTETPATPPPQETTRPKDKANRAAQDNKLASRPKQQVKPSPSSPEPHKPAPASPTEPIAKTDPAKLEGDINRALRNAGLKGVNAEVNDNLEVLLKGTVLSGSDKDKAFEVARTFREAKRIKDRVFIIEP